eukprot:TRINITY_DN55780_c0_g1_i1.p1 TRINITY_DN55780_c0_g1~~TRINITY_DN55780_c0_g1_i1.p1  ORF type:complete len:702 (-),score=96.84 TRINITY_DN55780_c0_g1_i1:169-2205(-)
MTSSFAAPLVLVGPTDAKSVEESVRHVKVIREALAAWGVEVEVDENVKADGRLVIFVSMDFHQLCLEAEHLLLMKALCSQSNISDSLQFSVGEGELRSLTEFHVSRASDFEGFTEASKCKGSGFFEPWEILFLTYRRLHRVAVPNKPEQLMLHSLMDDGIIETAVALHATPPKLKMCPCSTEGLDEIHRVFGDGVAAYFVFMRTFTLWLVPLGVFAVILRLTREKGVTVNTSGDVLYYELAVVLWAALFPKFLERAHEHFSCRWGRLDASTSELRRAGYHGKPAISPITGEPELYFSPWERGLRYAFSAAVTAVMLVVAFGVMILSLNLQGYIHDPESKAARGLEVTFGASIFLFEPLARLARPGQILDPTGDGDPFFFGYITYLPVILHAIVITFLNTIYSRVATRLTEWENHKLKRDFENSIIVKRFCFEAFDCYIALFYIAFYERDLQNLRGELQSLFHVDCFRRLLLETIVPYLLIQWKEASVKQEDAAHKKDDDRQSSKESHAVSYISRQLALSEHEEFDDYLEMIMQFGYLTLFAGAMPFSAFLAFFGNILEMYSDSFKLARAYQRPVAYSASSMPKTWLFVIKSMCWTSVLTNVLMFGWVSHQAEQVITSKGFFEGTGGVWLVFWMENLLLVASAGIKFLISSRPRWVKNAVRAREYRRLTSARALLKLRK